MPLFTSHKYSRTEVEKWAKKSKKELENRVEG
jgi:hypothetical protein